MLKQIIFLNPEEATESEASTWQVREAARGVVIDESGKVGLLYASKHNYYKLPGGGLDGDDRIVGFKRECEEELGCQVEVVKELGVVEEWRKIFSLRQISYVYVGKVVGEKREPNFTQHEIENGFQIAWMSPEEALEKLENSNTENSEGAKYIKPRDVAIMKEYLQNI